jgi:DNA-binding MarR family transcriptional regulator
MSRRLSTRSRRRSIDTLVRAGLVERTQDPNNRRRLALRLTGAGRERLSSRTSGSSSLQLKLERLAHSELRAVERAIEILERGL